MTGEQLDELERLARAAMPGPWREDVLGDTAWGVIDKWGTVVVGHDFVSSDDARYIAAASPETVLALIARVKELEKDLSIWQHCANCHERMDAPGHCSRAESEAEAAQRQMTEDALAQRDEAQARRDRLAAEVERLRDQVTIGGTTAANLHDVIRERDAELARLRAELDSVRHRVFVIITDSEDVIDRCGATGQLAEEILDDLRPCAAEAPTPAREESPDA